MNNTVTHDRSNIVAHIASRKPTAKVTSPSIASSQRMAAPWMSVL